MNRRKFCRTALAAGVTATLPIQYVYAKAGITDLAAVTSSGGETTLEGAAVGELAESMRGALLLSGDAGYDHARAIWNGVRH